jgi:hypothetical protein
MDVRLTQRTTNPLTIAAVLFILALVINSIGAKTGPQDFTESLSVIFVGLGLLFTVLACVRFALSYEPTGRENTPPQ